MLHLHWRRHTMRGAVLAAILLGGAQVQAASLSEALSNATFYHTGTAHATDGESAAARLRAIYRGTPPDRGPSTCAACSR